MLLITNGIWAQNAMLKNPKFKIGQTATYEFTLEQKQSGEPDSVNTMLNFYALMDKKDEFFGSKEIQEAFLSCKIRLKVLNVTPFTTTMQVDLLESADYKKKKTESLGDSLLYYKMNDIFKKHPLILTFTSDMKEYVVSNKEEMIDDLSDIIWQIAYGYNKDDHVMDFLSLTSGRNIHFITALYCYFAPSLFDLIQTFATPMTEGSTTKGVPLDGTNRYMKYLTTKTTKNEKGELTYISDFDKYTIPIYYSDQEKAWDFNEVDSVEVDSVADNCEVDSTENFYDVDTAYVDSVVDSTFFDSLEYDSLDSSYKYEPDTTLTEEHRIAKTHCKTRIGKDYWPIEISKTITLEDKNIVWTYRRKIKRVENK